MTEEKGPKSAADPRPGGVPYYIENECENCGEELVLYDELPDEALRQSDALADPEYINRETTWHDEWACPECLDGVYFDWPPKQHEEMRKRVEEFDKEDAVSLEEMEEKLDLEE